MKFQYSPGLFGYGAKGTDGSAGLAGLGLYFTDFNGETNRIQIENAIANDEVLWSSAVPGTKLPQGRVYQTMELFIDPRGYIYEIDASNDTYTATLGFLNKSQYFAFRNITDNGFDRYSNIYDASIKYIIDTYKSTNPIDYTLTPARIYSVEPKNFARIEHTDIVDSSYNAFTNYSSGAAPETEDHKAFAIVRDYSSNTFRIGNCTSTGGLRDVLFTFDISSLIYTRENSANIFSANTLQETVLTNHEKNTNLLFDPNFNRNPGSFSASSSISTATISWNLLDFVNDSSILGTLYFWKRQDPSGTYVINASTFGPATFFDLDSSGSLTIQGLTLSTPYEYKMVISKDGWERESEIKNITVGSTAATMTIVDPSNKLLLADASGWFTANSSYNYTVDISTDSPTGWAASSNQTWATLARNSSTGPSNIASFDVSLSYNNLASSRSVVVTIVSEAANASIGITQNGQASHVVYFTNDGSIAFNPPLTNQTVNVGIKLYSWVRVQRDYALGSRQVRATINLYNNGVVVATAHEDQTARNETIDASTLTSYAATAITSANQNKWQVEWTQLECDYDNNGDYEFSQVWGEITSITKTAPSIGGGIFSVADASKFWYAKTSANACTPIEAVSSAVPAMGPFV